GPAVHDDLLRLHAEQPRADPGHDLAAALDRGDLGRGRLGDHEGTAVRDHPFQEFHVSPPWVAPPPRSVRTALPSEPGRQARAARSARPACALRTGPALPRPWDARWTGRAPARPSAR